MGLSTGLEDCQMEAPIRSEFTRDVTGQRRVGTSAGSVFDPLELLAAEVREGTPCRTLFEYLSQFVNLHQIRTVKLCHEVAAAWHVCHLAFLLEHSQGFPDRAEAQTDLLGDGLLVDARAGF
jgi:hypothetical protein